MGNQQPSPSSTGGGSPSSSSSVRSVPTAAPPVGPTYQRSSTDAPVVGVAVIGLGQRLTSLLSLLMSRHGGGGHRPSYLKQMFGEDSLGLIEIRAVCDESSVALDHALMRLGPYVDVGLSAVPRFTSYQEMFADTSLDFEWVLIGSKNYLHREHCIAAFEHGKHVFCEKPLATTIEDCIAIRAAEAKSGKLFATGFVLRHAPFYCKIKELLESGVLGTLISVEATETLSGAHGGYIMRNWRRHRAETGPHILEKCCHDIDILNWLIDSLPSRVASFGGLDIFTPQNKPQGGKDSSVMRYYNAWAAWEPVDAFESEKDTEDNQVAIMEYRNKVRVTFHTNCNTALPERSLLICGTLGTLKGDLIKGDIVWRTIEQASKGASKEKWVRPDGKHDMHGGGDEIIIEDLVHCMDVPTDTPKATGEEGFRSAVVCLAIDQARIQGTVVDVEPIWAQFNV